MVVAAAELHDIQKLSHCCRGRITQSFVMAVGGQYRTGYVAADDQRVGMRCCVVRWAQCGVVPVVALWLLLLMASSLGAQPASWRLEVHRLDTSIGRKAGEAALSASYPDSLLLLQSLGDRLQQLRAAAFLEASFDSVAWHRDTVHAWLHLGPRYSWLSLTAEGLPADWLQRAGFREKDYSLKPVVWEAWIALRDRLVAVAADDGYPFVRVWLQARPSFSPQLAAAIQLDKGAFVRMGPLRLPGDPPLKSSFLEVHLGLVPGQPYNASRVRQIGNRLRELPYVALASPPQVLIANDEARIELPLNARPASRFDFILGILPDNLRPDRLIINGFLEGEVYNTFKRGERLAARFEQPRPLTQELQLALAYPYLPSLPLGLELSMNLYRQDTLFINIDGRMGFSYRLPDQGQLQLVFDQQSTNLLQTDSLAIAARGRLPDTLDLSRRSLGLVHAMQRLDYRFNPRSGWEIEIQAAAGFRSIERNAQLLAYGYGPLYDSLPGRTAQYRWQLSAAAYLPLARQSTLKGGLRLATLYSAGKILTNEQYRVGGNRLFRGFDEQSIFTDGYALATVEYRFLLGQNSFFYAFVDQGMLWAEGRDYPTGLGAGVSFETRAGMLGLSLALGRRQGQPFDPGSPKVHLGYVSLF